ncbi:MAG: LysM peptidoglycan-binding domain-containing protein [Jatrophihabitans sp.]
MLTLVLVMIVASVVALVLVNDDNSNSNRTAAGQPISSASVPTDATTNTDSATASGAPTSNSTLSVAEPAAKSTRTAATSVPAASTGTVPSASMSPVANDRPSKKAPRKTLTYTVQRGDNLYVIARWFALHGYGDLYKQNKAVIGANPDLIHPGQKITIKNGLMTATS